MNKKIVWLVTVLLLSATTFAEAQQPTKIPLIGFLVTSSRSAIPARIEAFRQGLRELGYVEGKTL
jgi:putative ABC transport system substrate-binding protein